MILTINGLWEIHHNCQYGSLFRAILAGQNKIDELNYIVCYGVALDALYWWKSILSMMYSNSHITTKAWKTLLMKAVKEIGLRSSSASGCGIFPMGTICSSFHCEGQSPVLPIEFIILETGSDSSGANSWVTALGHSRYGLFRSSDFGVYFILCNNRGLLLAVQFILDMLG